MIKTGKANTMSRINSKAVRRSVILIITTVLLSTVSCADGDIGEILLDEAIAKSTYVQMTGPSDDGSYNGALYDESAGSLTVGEDPADFENNMSEGYFMFNTPSGITADRIVYAAVYIRRVGSSGTPAMFGSFCVDHVSYLDPAGVISADISSFRVPENDLDWIVIPVTAQLKSELLNNSPYTRYRIYSKKTPFVNGIAEYILFGSNENSNFNYRPYLAVWYL